MSFFHVTTEQHVCLILEKLQVKEVIQKYFQYLSNHLTPSRVEFMEYNCNIDYFILEKNITSKFYFN